MSAHYLLANAMYLSYLRVKPTITKIVKNNILKVWHIYSFVCILYLWLNILIIIIFIYLLINSYTIDYDIIKTTEVDQFQATGYAEVKVHCTVLSWFI